MTEAVSARPARRLTVVASGGLGDCLLLTPFIRHFRRSRQFDWIDAAVPSGAVELFDHNPHLDRVIPCVGEDLYLWGLPGGDDAVFAPYLHIEGHVTKAGGIATSAEPRHAFNRTDLPVVRQLAAELDVRLENEWLELYTSAADDAWAEHVVRAAGRKPLVVLNGRSTYAQKELPVETWRRVVGALRDEAYFVTVHEAEAAALDIVCVPLPPIRRTAALVRLACAVVTVDSFLGHVAAAMGTPAAVVFGPSNPLAFGHAQHVAVRSTVCPHCADTPRRTACTVPRCMLAVSPHTVIDALRAAIATPAARHQ